MKYVLFFAMIFAMPIFTEAQMNTPVNLLKLYKEANWIENIKNLPKNWWERTEPWRSKDAKVTFSVGKSGVSSIQLARRQSEANARASLVMGKSRKGFFVGELIGSSVIQFKNISEEKTNIVFDVGLECLIANESEQTRVVYCVVAVPTTSLP